MTRVFLLGEGERDVGRPGKPTAPYDFEGDLPRLAFRISRDMGGPERFGYDAETLDKARARIPLAGRPTRSGGKSKQLRDAVLAALKTHDHVIALIDARTEEVSLLRRDITEILAQCHERSPGARVAIGLAIQEIEIWMLADPMSRRAAFGERVGSQPVPDDLEAVPDPKALWQERAGQCAPAGPMRADLFKDEQRRSAWQELRLEEVARRCPQGFAPFVRDVKRALPWASKT